MRSQTRDSVNMESGTGTLRWMMPTLPIGKDYNRGWRRIQEFYCAGVQIEVILGQARSLSSSALISEVVSIPVW